MSGRLFELTLRFTALVMWLMASALGCASTPRSAPRAESLAQRLEQELPNHTREGFGYGYGHHEPIAVSDLSDDESCREPRLYVCTVQGGPVSEQDGGIGLFDEKGELLDWMRIVGLEDSIEDTVSLRSMHGLPDSIVLRAVTNAGTDVHADSVLVVTVMGRKLVETFRAEGNYLSVNPGKGEEGRNPVEQRFTKLAFSQTEQTHVPRLIYMSYHEEDEGGPGVSVTKLYEYNKELRSFRLRH